MPHQLPAWSPISLGALARGLFPSSVSVSSLASRIGAEYGAERVVLTGSGTDALAIAFLAAAPEGRRPRIALPGWACYDLMTAADMADAEVVLYDLIPETLAPDLESLRGALAFEPHAVVVAHWFGVPVDLAGIAPMVHSAGALLIDDAAQGVGASVRGRPVGAGGDFGVLSFGRGKGRTGGGGGAAMAFTPATAELLARAAQTLQPAGSGIGSVLALTGQWALGRPSLYGIATRLPGARLGETIYHPAALPRRIAARNTAILAAVWEASSREAETRRANAIRWTAALRGVNDLRSYTIPADAVAGWLRYPVLISQEVKPIFEGNMARRHGVMPGYPAVLAALSVTSRRFFRGPTEMCGARTLVERLRTLPTHKHLRDSDLETLTQLVRSGAFLKTAP